MVMASCLVVLWSAAAQVPPDGTPVDERGWVEEPPLQDVPIDQAEKLSALAALGGIAFWPFAGPTTPASFVGAAFSGWLASQPPLHESNSQRRATLSAIASFAAHDVTAFLLAAPMFLMITAAAFLAAATLFVGPGIAN